MRNHNYILVFATVMLFFSCGREEDVRVEGDIERTTCLSAVMEHRLETKTVLSEMVGGMYYPLWEQGDSLAVFTGKGQKPAPFTLVSGAGETKALFEGTQKGDCYVALSPYMPEAVFDGRTLSFEIPGEQRYRQDSFSTNSFPMIAVSENGELCFKNLCAVIRLSLTGDCLVNTITLRSSEGLLSGPMHVDVNYSDAPSPVVGEGGRKEVTLKCLGVPLHKSTPTYFYIVVPSGTYHELSISIDVFTGSVTKTVKQQIILNRSEWRPVSSFMVDAPAIDLDNLPDNQIWYKTSSGELLDIVQRYQNRGGEPFNEPVLSEAKWKDYGIIILEGPLKTIEKFALSYDIINELHLPDCVEEIGWAALPQNLPSLRIPGHLRSLGFANLIGHKRIYGPLVADDGRSIVKDRVLLDVLDTDLEDYVTPPGIERLAVSSIFNKGFKNIVLSEGVRSFDAAIQSCQNLETITFPESLIDFNISGDFPKLKGFYGSSRCVSPDHKLLINPTNKRVVYAVQGETCETYELPEGVESLFCSFRSWPNLKKLVLPSSLTKIYDQISYSIPTLEAFDGPFVTEDGRVVVIDGLLNAFAGKGLKEYTFPGNAVEIRTLALSYNTELEVARFSEGTLGFGTRALNSCSNLRIVEMPTTIQYILIGVFDGDYNLEAIYLPVKKPPYVSSGGEFSILGGHQESFTKLKIYVPEESLSDYLSDANWADCWPFIEGYHFDRIEPMAPYESSDYSMDGKVTVLQEATEGNGIDVVLMGDAFSDRQIKDGTYLRYMQECADALFEVEPYQSFRNLFNVYVVNAVSASEDFRSGNTSFHSWVDTNTQRMGADTDKCIEYALKAIPASKIGEALILMMCNTLGIDRSAGVCSMMTNDSKESDYGSGIGVAFITRNERRALVHHELGGHGFAKLSDEYTNRAINDNPIDDEQITYFSQMGRKYGWHKNVDFTADPTKVKWNFFLADTRYDRELLGVYEGGGGNWKHGIYRPSYNSIMNNNYGGYNAPSREAIYYRIHKLAYGEDWQYDFEEFVRWDQGGNNIRPTSKRPVSRGMKDYEVRDPLPVAKFNPDEWTVTVMK